MFCMSSISRMEQLDEIGTGTMSDLSRYFLPLSPGKFIGGVAFPTHFYSLGDTGDSNQFFIFEAGEANTTKEELLKIKDLFTFFDDDQDTLFHLQDVSLHLDKATTEAVIPPPNRVVKVSRRHLIVWKMAKFLCIFFVQWKPSKF